jgi:hypothetical protein
VHEGTHVITDVFDAMGTLGIDKLSLKEKMQKNFLMQS